MKTRKKQLIKEVFICFSLRRCNPYQVQRDSLNSFQNTPKAFPKIQNNIPDSRDKKIKI